MKSLARPLLILLCLLTGQTVSAQEPRGWLGAEVRDLTKAEATQLGWETPRGALVTKVQERGSPAGAVGLRPGMVILSVDRTAIDGAADFYSVIDGKRPDVDVELGLLVAGRERRVLATIAARPQNLADERPVPHLMLDTGGHIAVVNALAFTPDGKAVVSASGDKIIRVWDWQAGKTTRFLRGQISAGDDGKVYAIALSPDGRLLAAGGWMKLPGENGHVIRLYDFASGTLLGVLKGHNNVVLGLAFSPNGRQLVSGSGDNTAIIWDVEGRSLVHQLEGHKDGVYAVAFTGDGARVITGSDDGLAKLWSTARGEEIATLSGHRSQVRAVVASAANDAVVSASRDGEIRVWDGKSGQYLRTLVAPGAAVGALSLTPDGKQLIATCASAACNYVQRVLDLATGRVMLAYSKHDNISNAAAVSPDGRLAATSGGNEQEVQIWDLRTGATIRTLAGKGRPGWAVGFSADGQRIAWGAKTKPGWNVNDYAEPTFSMRLPSDGRTLGRPEPLTGEAASQLIRARSSFGTYTLTHRKGSASGYDSILDLSHDGRLERSIERGPTTGNRHLSYSFAPDGRTIISGGSFGVLTAYDLTGQVIGQFVGHEGDVWSVAPSADGRLLISGSDDQTVRLWNLKSGELIVSLFHGTDDEWVMWTPQGYYAGSPGGDKIIGWQINRGAEQSADHVGADQLRRHLNRPDIVERALILASAERAVQEAHGTSFRLSDLLKRSVPDFRIAAPVSQSVLRGGRTQLKLEARPLPDAIKYIRVHVNGRQVDEINAPMDSGGLEPGTRTIDVPLARGRNEISVTLGNVVGTKTQTLTLMHEGDGDLDKRGTLFILSIGVDRYPALGRTCGPNKDTSCDLQFAGADARRLADAAERRLAPSHAKVVKRVLVNGLKANDVPTAGNILDGIDLLKRAKETDTVLLFIAGHGANDGSSYRFLATNAERSGDSFRTSTVVPWHFLQDAMETTKGRRILFVDTCHSSNAYNPQLGNSAYHANIIAFAANRFDQEALEDARLGHGLFTYAVAEALDTKGPLGGKRDISTRDLADYVVKRVDQLAKAVRGEQEPQYFRGRDTEDYTLAKW
jgi:WD40 repeat protein